MRKLMIVVTALWALGGAGSARAFGDLQNCDAIQDPNARMSCLYAHIAHLEQTLLSFSTDITDLRRALKEKLDANGVFKLQYVGNGTCLGYVDADKPPQLAGCDRPDSWKLARGSQSPGKDTVAKTDTQGKPGKDKSADKGKGKPKDKPDAQSQSQTAPKTPALSPEAPAAPQPN